MALPELSISLFLTTRLISDVVSMFLNKGVQRRRVYFGHFVLELLKLLFFALLLLYVT